MKVILSTTYDDIYLYCLPITTWAWNKIGVDVVCFSPIIKDDNFFKKFLLATTTIIDCNLSKNNLVCHFDSPINKQTTYAQCSRLYGAGLDLPEDEVLITGDVDMIVFGDYLKQKVADVDVFGSDLTPEKQVPICYISATVKTWREVMKIDGKTPQKCLDDLLGHIEAEHFRGNYWAKDQEKAFEMISSAPVNIHHHFRARQGTQFASKRYDRDDAFVLDRLNLDTIDYHIHRPAYEENNFAIMMKILEFHYPNEDFTWLREYTEAYKKLL